jgi:8-oxo-dGTP diphosphatase
MDKLSGKESGVNGESRAGLERRGLERQLGRMKPVKRSIALLVRSGPEDILVVRRPPDDEDLPDAWGLPAGSLRPGETWKEAARRAGREKLGVRLRPGAVLREGELERDAYRLRMRLYEASIEAGEPAVPQPVPGVTQYAAWAWAPPSRLEDAAARGSLCSRLALAWRDREG